jgi:hypothetical protein
MTSTASNQNMTVQSPSLNNQSQREWETHAQLAYLFARHARHDLANVHCALGMLEMVEQIQTDYPDTPLPEELNFENIRIKSRQDVKKVISISNDLVLLSQAAALPPYQNLQTSLLASLIEQHITNRLDSQQPRPDLLLSETLNTRVVAMGDMLGVALSVFYCQWTPWSQAHQQASLTTVTHAPNLVRLHFPADNVEMLSQFANQLDASQPDEPLALPLQQHLTTSTGTMAMWLARHIIITHGGTVSIAPDNPANSLTVSLPTVD